LTSREQTGYSRFELWQEAPISSEVGQGSGDDSVRGIASREVRRFIADIIEVAGGAGSVALDLERLGYMGGDGPFSEQSVRTWSTGALAPGSDLLFALARYYDLSLDEYAFGEPEDDRRETMLGFQERRDQLRQAVRNALRELVSDDERETEPAGDWSAGPPVGAVVPLPTCAGPGPAPRSLRP
jgi:hypothetical protein